MGTGKALTHNERLEKEKDIQVRQGRVGRRKRHPVIMDSVDVTDSSEDKDEGEELNGLDVESIREPQFMMSIPSAEDVQMDLNDVQPVSVTNEPLVVGSALRRNKDGTVAASITRRKLKKVPFKQHLLNDKVLTLLIDRTWSREMEDLTPPLTTSK